MANATTGRPLLLKQTRNFIAGRLLWLGGVCIKQAKALLAWD
jgi:hypothetical protein